MIDFLPKLTEGRGQGRFPADFLRCPPDKIAAALKAGLYSSHNVDRFIYLVNADGDPVNSYKGIDGDMNKNVSAPYIVCTEHTKADWDAYLQAHPNYEEPTTEESTTEDNE